MATSLTSTGVTFPDATSQTTAGVPPTGTGASGTWGISISGNAATASNGGVTSVNGSTGAVTVASGGDYIMRTYTSPATWTKPAGLKAVKVTVIGAGGNGGSTVSSIYGILAGAGSGAGGAIKYIPAPSIPGPVAATVGSAPSKTSSFGAFCSATGGGNGSTASVPGTPTAVIAGGTGSGGDLNASGEESSYPVKGGDSAFGFGIGARQYSRPPASPGIPGTGYGSGAQGAVGPGGRTGVGGQPGVVIVEEFY